MRNPDGISGAQLQSGINLAIVAIWGENQPTEITVYVCAHVYVSPYLSLCTYAFQVIFKKT